MKNYFLLILGMLGGGLAISSMGGEPEETIPLSSLTPESVENLFFKYAVDHLFSVTDDLPSRNNKAEDKGGNIEDNITILHLIARTPIQNIQDKGKLLTLAQQVLRVQPELINREQNQGFTPLHNAAYRGRNEMVKLFLQKGADRSKKDFFQQRTAAEWAEHADHPGTANLIRTYKPSTAPFEAHPLEMPRVVQTPIGFTAIPGGGFRGAGWK